ncbi:MAG: hypothetical protein JO235_23895 [Chroococcidiopsidaceae cyanobacterium CP_BM_RX_35]|nr:hypothetical protein [Chroococcidiopsidaceae cyanobacterium CP_BM_RX_35]
MYTIPKQLELNLWQELAAAVHEPVTANLAHLWQKLELSIAEIDELDRNQQLLLAGEAITQIVEIYVLRAKAILATLEFKDNSKGPILSEDFLDGLMRQSMSVNLSDLMEDLFLEDATPESQELETSSGSVALLVDKQTAQAMARQTRKETKKMVEGLAEQECVSDWARAIAHWMQQHSRSRTVSLVELQQGLGMPMLEVWLGLLLGGFGLEQSNKDFYCVEGIWIQNLDSKSEAKFPLKQL